MIKISDKAAEKIVEITANHAIVDFENGGGLRLSVRGGACAGLQYDMRLEPSPKEGDKTQTINGIPVFIDPKSALYILGLKIDYVDGLLEAGFRMENPQAVRTCGCGNSFGVQ